MFVLKLMLSTLLENDSGYPFQTMSILYLCCTLLFSYSDASRISRGQTLSRDLASLLNQQDHCIFDLFTYITKISSQSKHIQPYQLTLLHSKLIIMFTDRRRVSVINISNISNSKRHQLSFHMKTWAPLL